MAQQQIDSYHILEEIAAGGQASVHKAWDTRTGQIVALKVMHPHLAKDPGYLERFHREARLAASITHPNVIRIFDVGQDGEAHYMALEYLPLSLHNLIQTQGRFPVDRAVESTLQVAMGLQVAHDQGIIHRDIKPQNILIGFDGAAKVTDFGIGRAADFATMTQTGAVMGTPHYMSPEQAKGLPVDSRTDLYSLGIVLYQMLTGELPFDADTPWEVIRQQIEGHARPMRRLRGDVPRVVEQVVNRCLEKDPGKRYQSAQEMIQSLERALPDGAYRLRQQAAAAPQVVSNVVAPPVQPPAPPLRPKEAVAKPRSNRRAWLWGFASAIAVVAGLMVLGGLTKDPQPSAESTPAVVEREVIREVPVEVPVEVIVERAVESTVVEQEAVAMPVTSTLMPATTVTSATARPQPVPLETTLVLSRGATISSAVIDEETGLPIANVEIEAQSVVDGGPNSYASTGADGRYTLRGIAPGSYRIRAWTNRQNYIQELYGDAFNWDDASLVTVRGTQPIEGINFDLRLGAVLSGRVIDSATGLPISNIGISAGPADQGHISWTETDGNGNYALRGIPDGIVEVFVDGEGYIQGRTWVRVGAAEAVKGVDFDLTFGATISGRVTDEDTGLPIPNVWVNAGQKNWNGPSSGASTDADGRFKIWGVAPGTYILKAEGDWEGYIREIYNDTLSWGDADLVVVRGTEPVHGIHFSLKRGASISGQIVDESGHPIPNLDVSAGPVYGDHVSWTRTDGNGVYVLRGLPDGVIEIFVNGQDYIEGRMTVTIREGTDIVGLDF